MPSLWLHLAVGCYVKMKKLIEIVFLLSVLVSCSPCTIAEDDMIDEIKSFNRIKEELISKDSRLDWQNDLNQIKVRHSEISSDIESLQEKFSLCSIEYYQNMGLAFRFDCDTIRPICNYYMLYTLNPEDREEFVSYEQFVDFRAKRWDYDNHWSFIKKVHSYD